MKFARLLHLVDSAIPTGAFAYSYGLESSFTFGLVQRADQLRQHLYAYLQQVAGMELPYIHSCFALAHPPPPALLRDMAETYEAMMLVPALQRASMVQGKNWLRLLHSFYPEAGLLALQEWFGAQRLPLHFILVFALCLKQVGFTGPEAQAMFLHMALRDQVSAAIRLGLIGPMEGHRLQHDFYTVFEHLLEVHAGREYTQACRSAFLLEVAQVWHEDVYSKLFQN